MPARFAAINCGCRTGCRNPASADRGLLRAVRKNPHGSGRSGSAGRSGGPGRSDGHLFRSTRSGPATGMRAPRDQHMGRAIIVGVSGRSTRLTCPTRLTRPAYWIEWHVSQSWLIFLPSRVAWSSSWQRKQPGKSTWPMLFGYVPNCTFISGNTLRR